MQAKYRSPKNDTGRVIGTSHITQSIRRVVDDNEEDYHRHYRRLKIDDLDICFQTEVAAFPLAFIKRKRVNFPKHFPKLPATTATIFSVSLCMPYNNIAHWRSCLI